MLSMSLGSNIQAETNSTKLEARNETVSASRSYTRTDFFISLRNVRDLEPYGIGESIEFDYVIWSALYQYDDGTSYKETNYGGTYASYPKGGIKIPSLAYIQVLLNNGRTSFPFLFGRVSY